MSNLTNNKKITFGETTFEFSIKIQLEDIEIFDVLINGVKSIYYVQFKKESKSYSVHSADTDRNGDITHRDLIPFGINGKSGFPINVVCDIIKTIDEHFVR